MTEPFQIKIKPRVRVFPVDPACEEADLGPSPFSDPWSESASEDQVSFVPKRRPLVRFPEEPPSSAETFGMKKKRQLFPFGG